MRKWEYALIYWNPEAGFFQDGLHCIDLDTEDEMLQFLGEDSWELVSVVVNEGKFRYFFKRPQIKAAK